MHSVAIVSLHSSPLVQPGSGDSGGMNVYVRELAASLAQAGVRSDVYVRRWQHDLPDVIDVEPGFRVVHLDAGDADLTKEHLPGIIDAFADGLTAQLAKSPADVLHANYWLSGLAAHSVKHELDMPLMSTFHTLARVKAETGDPEPGKRIEAEALVMGCSDAITASCPAEADQLVRLYDVDPTRIELVAPGVDHAFFSPGSRSGARSALGLPDVPVLLFVGRIQPLKGLSVAIAMLEELKAVYPEAMLVVIGGPSGTGGEREQQRCMTLADERGVADAIRWIAPLPHHLLSTYYRSADVVVVPSRSESFGLVALEAAASGIPVVASAVGGLTTIVNHGQTGLLVDTRDPRDWANAVGSILADATWANDLGRQGAHGAQRFRWSVTAARLRRLYGDLSTRSRVDCAA